MTHTAADVRPDTLAPHAHVQAREVSAAPAISRTELFWVIAVVAFGTLLRLRGLTTFPFEQDELYTLRDALPAWSWPPPRGIMARPLYYLMQSPLLTAFGVTPLSMRILPFIFGIGGLVATWRLGRYVAGPVAGIVAALLLAVSPWHLHASGMARYWSLVYLFATIALLFLIRATEYDRARYYLLALLVLVLGVVTHPTFEFPMLGAVLALRFVRDDGALGWTWPTRNAWRYLWGPGVAVALLAAVYIVMAQSGLLGRSGGGRGPMALLRLVPAMVQWMTPTMAVAGAAGMALMFASGVRLRKRFALVAILGCFFSVGILLFMGLRRDVYADYAMAMLPLVFVSAGGLVQLGWEALQGRAAAALVAIGSAVMVAGVLPSTASHLADGTRYEYRPAFARIAREAPERLTLMWPTTLQSFYAPELRSSYLFAPVTRLDSLLAAEGELWAVASYSRHGLQGDGDPAVAQWLLEQCRTVQTTERLRLDYRAHRVALMHCEARGSAVQPDVR